MNFVRKNVKVIEDVRRRVEYGIGIPDKIKDLYYKGLAKREAGLDLILKAKFELEVSDKWGVKLKGFKPHKKGIDKKQK
jgi:hypothetical protein